MTTTSIKFDEIANKPPAKGECRPCTEAYADIRADIGKILRHPDTKVVRIVQEIRKPPTGWDSRTNNDVHTSLEALQNTWFDTPICALLTEKMDKPAIDFSEWSTEGIEQARQIAMGIAGLIDSSDAVLDRLFNLRQSSDTFSFSFAFLIPENLR